MPAHLQSELVMPILHCNDGRACMQHIDCASPESIREQSWKDISRQLIMTRRVSDCVIADSFRGVECMLKATVLEVAGAEEALAQVVAAALPDGYRAWAQQHLESVIASRHNRATLGAHCAATVAWGRAWKARVTEESWERVACFLLQSWHDDYPAVAATTHSGHGSCFVMCAQNYAAAPRSDAAATLRIEQEIRELFQRLAWRARPHPDRLHQTELFGSGRLQVVSVMAAAALSRVMNHSLEQDSRRNPI